MSYEEYVEAHRPFEEQARRMYAEDRLGFCRTCGSPLRPLARGDVGCSGNCGWVGVVRDGQVRFFAKPATIPKAEQVTKPIGETPVTDAPTGRNYGPATAIGLDLDLTISRADLLRIDGKDATVSITFKQFPKGRVVPFEETVRLLALILADLVRLEGAAEVLDKHGLYAEVKSKT